MMQRTFHIGAVMSAMTGVLCCPISELYEILNHLTGEDLMTHELPAASTAAAPVLGRRYPDLAELAPPLGWTEEGVKAWVEDVSAKYGATREVDPLPAGAFVRGNPIDRLLRMAEGRTASS